MSSPALYRARFVIENDNFEPINTDWSNWPYMGHGICFIDLLRSTTPLGQLRKAGGALYMTRSTRDDDVSFIFDPTSLFEIAAWNMLLAFPLDEAIASYGAANAIISYRYMMNEDGSPNQQKWDQLAGVWRSIHADMQTVGPILAPSDLDRARAIMIPHFTRLEGIMERISYMHPNVTYERMHPSARDDMHALVYQMGGAALALMKCFHAHPNNTARAMLVYAGGVRELCYAHLLPASTWLHQFEQHMVNSLCYVLMNRGMECTKFPVVHAPEFEAGTSLEEVTDQPVESDSATPADQLA